MCFRLCYLKWFLLLTLHSLVQARAKLVAEDESKAKAAAAEQAAIGAARKDRRKMAMANMLKVIT